MSSTPQNNETRFIERSGLIAEREGFPRIAGRIFGLLLLSPTELSLDEIASRLSVSRASVSTDARRLVDAGIIERVGRIGDRKDYYQIAPTHYLRSLEQRFANLQEFVGLLEDARRFEHASPEVGERLNECSRAFTECLGLLNDTLTRWRRGLTTTTESAEPPARQIPA
jgi:DNA-binding transcriptional regulator GbsR (MarR family)